MNVLELVTEHCLQLEADGRSAPAIHQMKQHGKLFAQWLASVGASDTVADLTPPIVARFLASPMALKRHDGKPKLTSTMNALRTSMRCLLRFAHDSGFAPQNAARLVRRAPCATPPPRAMPPDDVEKLLATLAAAEGPIAAREHALFHLIAATGLRVGSVLALHVEHVDLRAGTIRIEKAKGGMRGRVYLNREIREILVRFIGDRKSGPLFANRAGRPLTNRHAQVKLAEWLARAGVEQKYSPHSLRHSFAMELLGRTGDLALVRDALLHRSFESTLRYARSDEQRLRAALGA
ncbi:MAG: hypothetical protein EPO68_12440 [Planctomycetota bacterium]|nr:MAG: hypothetical protein EPO68_12440 [Planctomycetota bacterium]